jgi:DoxX
MTATTIEERTSKHLASPNGTGAASAASKWSDPRYQAFALMRLAFTIAPIAFGLDKFFNIMVYWPHYLAPWINDIAPGTGQQFMYFVGATEILAGVIVALKPRYGAYVVAGWLTGIILNLLTYSGFYDIALRDFGLMLGALTLTRLASVYDPPLKLGRR